MDRASLEIRMSRSENLPVLPQAVSAIIHLADDPTISQRDLEKAFERDPAITAKILRVANSAYYGGGQAASIGRAISLLGVTAIRSLVVGVAFQQMIGGKEQSKQFNKLEFWQHSLATAVACRILGKLRLPVKAEELYCAGMMHDIGLLVFDKFIPGDLDDCLEESRVLGEPLHEVEKRKMGYDHAEIGGILAGKWNLSQAIQNGIRYHHHFQGDISTSAETMLVAAGNCLAHECGYTQGMRPSAMENALAAALELPPEQLKVIKEVVVQEVVKAQEAFKIAA